MDFVIPENDLSEGQMIACKQRGLNVLVGKLQGGLQDAIARSGV